MWRAAGTGRSAGFHGARGNRGDARAMFKTDPWMGSILQIAAIERWTLWIGADRL
jgi:hypothetical protein